MLRLLVIVVVLLAVIALLTRAPTPRRILFALAAFAVIYTILKLTGVIDAMAPDRIGVFGL
jgi:hypothetical protein